MRNSIEKSNRWSIAKILLSLAVSAYFFYIAKNHTDWHFLDAVNLIFHEAGHTLAVIFPKIIQVSAGSLFQLFIPLVCFLHLYHSNNYYSSYLVLFWVGQSILNISVYAADAQLMMLPLLGGENVTHDWNFILDYLGLLRHTDIIAQGIYFFGIVVIATAATLSLLSSKDKLNPNTD